MEQYIECPYCVFRYKVPNNVKGEELKQAQVRLHQAMAGHIGLKHPNNEQAKISQNYNVEIPKKDPEERKKQIDEQKARLKAELDRLDKLGKGN